MKLRSLAWLTVAAAALFALTSEAAHAQPYPSRSIRLVVPFAPGGPADFLGRLIGLKLSEEFGQQVIVDNRAGANTIIGAQAVAKAAPDGYTLLMAIDGTLVMNPFMYSKLPYAVKDFELVGLIAEVPSVLVANNKVPANSIKELIALEKAKPGTFMIGSSTPTTQVGIELLNMMAGTKMSIVPYKGGNTQITAELAGDIPLGMESLNVAMPLWRAGKIKILGSSTPRRIAQAPEIAPIADTYPGYDMGIWQSIVAPAGTPRAIVDKLNAALKKVLSTPDVRDKIIKAGIEPRTSTPEDFAAFVRAQSETRSKVIKAIGMKLD